MMFITKKAVRKYGYIGKDNAAERRREQLEELTERYGYVLEDELLRLWDNQVRDIDVENLIMLIIAYQLGERLSGLFSGTTSRTRAFADAILAKAINGISAEAYVGAAEDFKKIDTPVSRQNFIKRFLAMDFGRFDVMIKPEYLRYPFDFLELPEANTGARRIGLNFDDFLDEYVKEHTGKWVKEINDVQLKNIKSVIENTLSGGRDMRTAAQLIKNSVGLTEKQFSAAMKYYDKVRGELSKGNPNLSIEEINAAANNALNRYVERKRAERARTIARTETAIARNKAYDLYIRESQKLGLMGKVVLKWVCAKTGNVCKYCKVLDGKTIDINGEFDVDYNFCGDQKRLPPAHPNCRCVVIYIEVAE